MNGTHEARRRLEGPIEGLIERVASALANGCEPGEAARIAADALAAALAEDATAGVVARRAEELAGLMPPKAPPALSVCGEQYVVLTGFSPVQFDVICSAELSARHGRIRIGSTALVRGEGWASDLSRGLERLGMPEQRLLMRRANLRPYIVTEIGLLMVGLDAIEATYPASIKAALRKAAVLPGPHGGNPSLDEARVDARQAPGAAKPQHGPMDLGQMERAR